MNKLSITAYMFLLWAAVSFSGCAGKGRPQMYLEAKAQDGKAQQESAADLDTQNTDTQNTEQNPEQNQQAVQEPESCFVFVCGAVKHPGVFELPSGSRVYEAIALAGGLRKDAYEKGINQARKIEDGDMIEVLTEEEQLEAEKETAGKAQEEAAGELQAQDGRIDINTASMEQLMSLNGIGEAKAANIIEYRESAGRFSAAEELMNVNGIGEGVYARIKDKIKVTQ